MENITYKIGKESNGNLDSWSTYCAVAYRLLSIYHSVFLQTLDLRGGYMCSLAKGRSMVKQVWEILVQEKIILQEVECKPYFSMATDPFPHTVCMPRASETHWRTHNRSVICSMCLRNTILVATCGSNQRRVDRE